MQIEYLHMNFEQDKLWEYYGVGNVSEFIQKGRVE